MSAKIYLRTFVGQHIHRELRLTFLWNEIHNIISTKAQNLREEQKEYGEAYSSFGVFFTWDRTIGGRNTECDWSHFYR
jgi:hypothetical protein